MNDYLIIPLLLSLLCTACTLPVGGAPLLRQVYSTALQQSYGVAIEERTSLSVVADKKIELDLEDQFAKDNVISLMDISAFCYNGHVFLVGQYGTNEEWARAVEITAREEGVKSITTYILMKSETPTCGLLNNFMLYANVRAKLILDEDIRSTNIDIKTVQCHVVLLGIVASSREIDLAISRARSIEGVVRVQSFLEAIRRPTFDERSAPETGSIPFP